MSCTCQIWSQYSPADGLQSITGSGPGGPGGPWHHWALEVSRDQTGLTIKPPSCEDFYPDLQEATWEQADPHLQSVSLHHLTLNPRTQFHATVAISSAQTVAYVGRIETVIFHHYRNFYWVTRIESSKLGTVSLQRHLCSETPTAMKEKQDRDRKASLKTLTPGIVALCNSSSTPRSFGMCLVLNDWLSLVLLLRSDRWQLGARARVPW